MRFVRSLLLSTTLLSAGASAAHADVNVVASIKPVHSLVAAVMEGVGEPGLIVEGAGSPHTYALKPSQARMLEDADVVFWVGHDLEAFLEKPLEALAKDAKTVELMDAHGLVRLAFREGGAFDAHDHGHDDHAEDGHDDHADDGHDDHGHDEHAEDGHDEHGHEDHGHDDHAEHDHGHSHGAYDPHVWLDPLNAKALVHEIEEALAAADPTHAAVFEANAERVMQRLDDLVREVTDELAPVKDTPFVVFHDAYQNFENRFGLSAVGAITVSPEVMPGAERIRDLRGKVQHLGAACVFSEPQFEPKLVSTVADGTGANTGILDPLGAAIDDGPELYFTLIRNMSAAFRSCLSETG
jgi:zinc transport system substrate-binding protein